MFVELKKKHSYQRDDIISYSVEGSQHSSLQIKLYGQVFRVIDSFATTKSICATAGFFHQVSELGRLQQV